MHRQHKSCPPIILSWELLTIYKTEIITYLINESIMHLIKWSYHYFLACIHVASLVLQVGQRARKTQSGEGLPTSD